MDVSCDNCADKCRWCEDGQSFSEKTLKTLARIDRGKIITLIDEKTFKSSEDWKKKLKDY